MILRYFNAAGMDFQAGLRRTSHSLNFLIPRALQALRDPKMPLSVFGVDYPTPDGTAIRDYIHVTDLADAHLLALQYLQKNRPNIALNLGTGRGYSVYEIVRMIEEVAGKKLPLQIKPRREGDVAQTVADPSSSQAVLGFTPRHSDLREIIESEWIAFNSGE